jgi:hypothetical protein
MGNRGFNKFAINSEIILQKWFLKHIFCISRIMGGRCKQNKKNCLLDPNPSFGQLCSYWPRADWNLFKNYNLKTKGIKLVNLVSIDISFKAPKCSYILNKNKAQIKITQLIKHFHLDFFLTLRQWKRYLEKEPQGGSVRGAFSNRVGYALCTSIVGFPIFVWGVNVVQFLAILWRSLSAVVNWKL